MTAHPNRGGPKGPASNPTPAAIRAAREAAGLSQSQAGDLIYSGLRSWQHWEAGERRMHPALWELFTLKLREQEGAPGSSQLAQALFYAGQSRDIPSLTSIARQESNRADLAERMLVAVLEVAGPTRIQRGVISQHGTRGRVSLVSDGEEWAIVSAQPSQIQRSRES